MWARSPSSVRPANRTRHRRCGRPAAPVQQAPQRGPSESSACHFTSFVLSLPSPLGASAELITNLFDVLNAPAPSPGCGLFKPLLVVGISEKGGPTATMGTALTRR